MKPGFKQTEVGLFPEDWAVEPLGRHATFRTGPFGSALHKSDYTNDGVPIVNPMHIVEGKIVPTRTMTITEDAAKNLSDFRMTPGEIVIGRRGDMGRCAVVQEDHLGWLCGTGSMIIRPRNAAPEFLQRVLSSPRAISAIKDASVGTTMVNLNQSTLSGLKLQFPPLPEQRAIASALSDVDALLDGLDRLIAKKRDLKQAAMQQLLTGQTRLPGFHGKWKPLDMAHNSLLKARIGWQGLTTAEYLAAGIYHLVTGTDFSAGKVNWATCPFVAADRYEQDRNIQLRPNDVLVTKDGSIGKVAFVDKLPGPATLNSGVFVIRPKCNAYQPKFLYYILASAVFEGFLTKLAAGSTISHLYQKDFVSFAFLAPPTVEEQAAIADALSDMDAELATLEARRDKTRDLKQAMMQELLTGKTRLVAVEVAHA